MTYQKGVVAGDGHLNLDSRGIWMYTRTISGKRFRKSTGTRDLHKAIETAESLSKLSHITSRKDYSYYSDRDYKMILKNSRKNAKARNIPHVMTDEEFKVIVDRANGYCEVTGIKFKPTTGLDKHEKQPFGPSLDRIDSNRGYSADNCRLICTAANLAINSWGDWVLAELAYATLAKHKVGGLQELIKRNNGNQSLN